MTPLKESTFARTSKKAAKLFEATIKASVTEKTTAKKAIKK